MYIKTAVCGRSKRLIDRAAISTLLCNVANLLYKKKNIYKSDTLYRSHNKCVSYNPYQTNIIYNMTIIILLYILSLTG